MNFAVSYDKTKKQYTITFNGAQRIVGDYMSAKMIIDRIVENFLFEMETDRTVYERPLDDQTKN